MIQQPNLSKLQSTKKTYVNKQTQFVNNQNQLVNTKPVKKQQKCNKELILYKMGYYMMSFLLELNLYLDKPLRFKCKVTRRKFVDHIVFILKDILENDCQNIDFDIRKPSINQIKNKHKVYNFMLQVLKCHKKTKVIHKILSCEQIIKLRVLNNHLVNKRFKRRFNVALFSKYLNKYYVCN